MTGASSRRATRATTSPKSRLSSGSRPSPRRRAAARTASHRWALGQGEDVVPIPGTKRITYLGHLAAWRSAHRRIRRRSSAVDPAGAAADGEPVSAGDDGLPERLIRPGGGPIDARARTTYNPDQETTGARATSSPTVASPIPPRRLRRPRRPTSALSRHSRTAERPGLRAFFNVMTDGGRCATTMPGSCSAASPRAFYE